MVHLSSCSTKSHQKKRKQPNKSTISIISYIYDHHVYVCIYIYVLNICTCILTNIDSWYLHSNYIVVSDESFKSPCHRRSKAFKVEGFYPTKLEGCCKFHHPNSRHRKMVYLYIAIYIVIYIYIYHNVYIEIYCIYVQYGIHGCFFLTFFCFIFVGSSHHGALMFLEA